MEITARGSLQIRGLSEASAPLFAAAVDRLDIGVRTGVPVQTSALAGLDPGEIVDPTSLSENIRAGIAKAGLGARLGPKVSMVVDGGGRTALAEVAADVRLMAISANSAPLWQVAVAGDARTARALGVVEGDEAACKAAVSILSEIAAMGREARARDLDAEKLQSVLGHLEVGRLMLPTFERSLMGTIELRDPRIALGIALPFGHTTANLLRTFGEAAEALGVEDIRPAPRRTLVAICGTQAKAEELRKQAEALGLVTSTDDPRQSISACPGAPECASGHIPARRMAAEIANEYSGLLDGSVHLHVSGCAKGCAHPAVSDLVIVGSEAGTGLVLRGTARDAPLAFATNDGAGRGFANVAALVSAERRAEETTAQAVQRIGHSALAEAFGQGRR